MPFLLALVLLLLAPAASRAAPFEFLAFGDMPYCGPSENPCADEARVHALVDRMNAAAPAFSVFVGDTKAGGEPCTDAIVEGRTRRWFARFAHPLIYTPGDNEWTDCWQARAGRFDPLDRLALIRRSFFAERESLGAVTLPLARQADIDPARRDYVENARWTHQGVVFATVHVVGSDNNRPPLQGPQPPGADREYPARDAANVAWIEAAFAEAERVAAPALVLLFQADIFFRDRCGFGDYEGHAATRRALLEGAVRYRRPVLLVHGDSHFFLVDLPLRGEGDRTLGNVTRLMVPGAEDIRAVRVRVDPEAEQPFGFALLGDPARARGPSCP
jgi:hypothetical protein